jgi:hypothetical protein
MSEVEVDQLFGETLRREGIPDGGKIGGIGEIYTFPF